MTLHAPQQEDGAAVDLDSQRQGKCVVLKTSTRQTIFLPVVGLVDAETLKPGDLVGVNKDSYLILDTLPAEYDSRVKAMEVDEKPTEDYSDVGGLDKQIQELVEAIVLPVTHKDKFKALGIKPPKVCQVTTVAGSPPVAAHHAQSMCGCRRRGCCSTDRLAQERRSSPEPAQHRRTPRSSSLQARSLCRCSSATGRSSCAMPLPLRRRRLLRLSS